MLIGSDGDTVEIVVLDAIISLLKLMCSNGCGFLIVWNEFDNGGNCDDNNGGNWKWCAAVSGSWDANANGIICICDCEDGWKVSNDITDDNGDDEDDNDNEAGGNSVVTEWGMKKWTCLDGFGAGFILFGAMSKWDTSCARTMSESKNQKYWKCT